MLCGIPSSPHQHRFLRSFRSHKNLRQTNTSAFYDSQDDMYSRRPSDASGSLARPSLESSPRPSTSSSSRTNMSIDWDPLRLHPSQTQGPAPPLRDAFGESTSRLYQPQELRQARCSSKQRQQPPASPSRPRHHTSPSSTVIYDGFDFGFNNTPTPAMSKTTPTRLTTTHHRMRAPSPTPSDASSECSLALSGSSALDDSSPLEDMGLGLGLAPAPVPRPRPRPRPRAADGPSPLGLDGDADFFLRRGGWKRRGIVFVTPAEDELAGEEESFEI